MKEFKNMSFENSIQKLIFPVKLV